MSAHFRRLHPYTCQRLVQLLCVLNKRRVRVVQQLKSSDLEGTAKSYYTDMYTDGCLMLT